MSPRQVDRGVWRRSVPALCMMDHSLLNSIPVWLLSLWTAVVVLLSVFLGFRLAVWRRRRPAGKEEHAPEGIGAVVAALFGLLAFMLAFTFGMAASRREARRDLLLDEVNSISTTYLRAGLLDESHCRDVRQLLRRYVDLRIDIAEHPELMVSALAEARSLHVQLWSHAEQLAAEELKNPDIVSLFVVSLNQTIDLQTSRVTNFSYRIPLVVWLAFFILTVISAMSLGYSFGSQSDRCNWTVAAMLSISFATVVLLIFDLDRGAEGWLRISQQPMYELRQTMAP